MAKQTNSNIDTTANEHLKQLEERAKNISKAIDDRLIALEGFITTVTENGQLVKDGVTGSISKTPQITSDQYSSYEVMVQGGLAYSYNGIAKQILTFRVDNFKNSNWPNVYNTSVIKFDKTLEDEDAREQAENILAQWSTPYLNKWKELCDEHNEKLKEASNTGGLFNKSFDEANQETQASLGDNINKSEPDPNKPEGPQESTEKTETTNPEEVQITGEAAEILKKSEIDMAAGFLSGDTTSPTDSKIIKLIAAAAIEAAKEVKKNKGDKKDDKKKDDKKKDNKKDDKKNNGGSNVIPMEDIGNALKDGLTQSMMNVINSELASEIQTAQQAFGAYKQIKYLVENIHIIVPEMIESLVTFVTNGVMSSVTKNLMTLLDPQPVIDGLTYYASYYTKLCTKGIGQLMEEINSATTDLAKMKLEAANKKAEEEKKNNFQQKLEAIKQKADEIGEVVETVVPVVLTYATQGVPMVQRILTTYGNWVIKKADKYITAYTNWLCEKRDEFIQWSGEKIGSALADAINKKAKDEAEDKLKKAAAKVKSGLLVAIAAIMTAVQMVVGLVGPMLGKLIKMGVKMAIDAIIKQIKKAVQDAIKAASEAAKKKMQELTDKAAQAVSDASSKVTGALGG
jgi:hypothetical protein